MHVEDWLLEPTKPGPTWREHRPPDAALSLATCLSVPDYTLAEKGRILVNEGASIEVLRAVLDAFNDHDLI
jgi:hypothetical protein